MTDLASEIETAIAAGEKEIGDLSARVHATAARVNHLIVCRTDLATLQKTPPREGADTELARIVAKVQRLKSPPTPPTPAA